MPLFKDNVALEACPAKTAESVSYGLTFAVLGWLVVSNYSGLGFAGIPDDAMAVTEPSAEIPANLPPTVAIANTESANAQPLSSAADAAEYSPLLTAETVGYSPLADLTAWHSRLEQAGQSANPHGFREFSASAWSSQPASQAQAIEPFLEELSLPLPLINSELLFRPAEGLELASIKGNNSGPVHEITVTGLEQDRISTRPDNIRRPQLPRPYRAQEVQRSLILPPRIQALRP